MVTLDCKKKLVIASESSFCKMCEHFSKYKGNKALPDLLDCKFFKYSEILILNLCKVEIMDFDYALIVW